MLAAALSKGSLIKGLAPLLDGGGVVGEDHGQVQRRVLRGSYTQNGRTFTFHANNEVKGAIPINILPYVAGAINYIQMQGRETISGEFTGCSMAIYNFDGTTRICHVDTAKTSVGPAPSIKTWKQIKSIPGFEMADEKETSGMIGDYLDTASPDELGRCANLRILCIATPVVGIRSFYVLKEGASDYRVLRAE